MSDPQPQKLATVRIHEPGSPTPGYHFRRSSPDSCDEPRSPPAHILDAKSGFFDYTEEKNLHHVRPLHAPRLRVTALSAFLFAPVHRAD